MPDFRVSAAYRPTGDQPQAVAALSSGVLDGARFQTLLGATGTGKTATMAWIIEQVQRPALVIAHNKTLAAQLCNEFREFFPHNAVEYFVSYYDYYQPEAYVPQADLYIEKDASINDDIDRLRHSATSSLLMRRDVVIVASVSCIYGLGSPAEYREQTVLLSVGEEHDRDEVLRKLVVDPVPAQRLVPRPRALPGARRRRRGAAAGARVRLPGLVLRRRGRADHALRPADGRGARPARPPGALPGDAVRDRSTDHRARARGDRGGARGAGAGVRGRRGRCSRRTGSGSAPSTTWR